MTSALWLHEIAESSHRILNAFDLEKVLLVGELAGVGAASRVLDLCCGKGELLTQWAAHYGSRGHGVDASTVFLTAARERGVALGVADHVSFGRGDAADYTSDERFDVVCCIGASWYAGDLDRSLAHMRGLVVEDGTLLLGEPFWHTPPSDELARSFGEPFRSLPALVEHLGEFGLEVVEFVAASQDDWDRYCAAQWRNLHDWLRAHPDDERGAAVRERLEISRRRYFGGQRQQLGWGVFVLRTA